MKLGSLFDGSGTCPLAASAVGIVPAWASEIEPFPMAVTKSRFPRMAHLGDITKMNGGEIEPVDVITFGSPCQNLSIAGNREGLAGDESWLFLEAVRVIREMRCATNGKYPQIAIWENVYGAYSATKGEDFRTVLETLWKVCEPDDSVPRFATDNKGVQRWPRAGCILGDHSSIAWRGLDAQFWGVAQRRKRVFLVLDLGGQCAAQILFEREGLSRDFKAVRRKGQTLTPAADSGSLEHNLVYAVENHAQDGRCTLSPDNIVQTLAGRMGTGGGNIPLILCKATPQANAEICENLAPTLSAAAGMSGNNQPIVTVPVFGFHQNGSGEVRLSDHAYTLSTNSNASGRNSPLVAVPISFGQTAYDDYEPTEQAVTLKASGGNYGGEARW